MGKRLQRSYGASGTVSDFDRPSVAWTGHPTPTGHAADSADEGLCGTFGFPAMRPFSPLKRRGTDLNTPVDLETPLNFSTASAGCEAGKRVIGNIP